MAQIQVLRQELKTFSNVKTFLDSIGRNSTNSKKTYETALMHFHAFLDQTHRQHNPDTIIAAIISAHINQYTLLEEFVTYLHGKKLSPKTIRLNVAGIRSYLAYNDVDIDPYKFKRRVHVPKVYREDEEPLSAEKIRKILLACNFRRLKSYCLTLATGGMRAVEGLAIRVKDIDFSTRPVTITIRKEYSKTRTARTIYISDEAAHNLQGWMNFKYRQRVGNNKPRTKDPNDLVFNVIRGVDNPKAIYHGVAMEFQRVLEVAGFTERKDGSIRHKFTLHSFRRFTKSVLSDSIGEEYSELFLGHGSKSSYYVRDSEFKANEYVEKAMKYLTFLDYSTLEATRKNIEVKLSEKDREIAGLKGDVALLKQTMADMQQLLRNPEKAAQIAKA